ncbi:MAG: Crp/Fnr family transcriptional regulator [Calditrichaeota bacterium]|nr:Crp/Fnr family transcriptional regulator [Calditrichota bacterium]
MRFDSNFWQAIDSRYHPELKAIAVERTIRSQEFLFQDKDPYYGFYVIRTGKFRLFNLNDAGDEATISVLGKDQTIALVPIFTGQSHNHAYCQAIEDNSFYFFDKNKFISLIKKRTDLLFSIAEMAVDFTLGFRDKYLSVILQRAEDRIIDFLRELGAETTYVKLPLAKKQLASLLDITPESLSRLLNKLKTDKILSETDGAYRINKYNFTFPSNT